MRAFGLFAFGLAMCSLASAAAGAGHPGSSEFRHAHHGRHLLGIIAPGAPWIAPAPPSDVVAPEPAMQSLSNFRCDRPPDVVSLRPPSARPRIIYVDRAEAATVDIQGPTVVDGVSGP